MFSLFLEMSSGELNESVPVRSTEDLENEQTEPVGTQCPSRQTADKNSLDEIPTEHSDTPRLPPVVQPLKVCPPTLKEP